jgi:hypothetical protein
MSLLFTFDGHPLHVLHLRGRSAFIAAELGAAAGYGDDAGQRFVDLICRDWARSFEEDDDIAQVVGAELEAIKREVGLPATTKMLLVLFPSGAERALVLSRSRVSRSLIGFVHAVALARILTFPHGEPADETGDSEGDEGSEHPQSAPAQPREKAPEDRKGVLLEALAKLREVSNKLKGPAWRAQVYVEIVLLASDLLESGCISQDQWAALRVEAVEELIGRPLRSPLPPFGDDAPNAPSAA